MHVLRPATERGEPEGLRGMDYIIPLSRGGSRTIENVRPACPRCNASKAGLMVIEWIAWREEGILTRRGRGARRNLRAA